MLFQAKDDGPAGTSTSLKSFSEAATTILGGEAAPTKLHLQQSSLKPLEDCGPSTQWMHSRIIVSLQSRGLSIDDLLQHLQYRPAHCSSSEEQLILPRQSIIQPAVLNQNALYWCNLCQVKCKNAFNLKQHYQSEAHSAKRKSTYKNKSTMPNGNKMLWCNECKVACMNEISLSQRRAGKKHAARLFFFASKSCCIWCYV